MASVTITDFKQGMSRAAGIASLTPGACWDLRNCHINREGRIERAKRWVPVASIPAGCFGLYSFKRHLWAFGSGPAPSGLSPRIGYLRLQHPSGHAMTAVLSVQSSGGALYVIASYSDGSIHHFFNSQRVTAWDAFLATATLESTADALAALIEREHNLEATTVYRTVVVTGKDGIPFSVAADVASGGGPQNDQAVVVSVVQAAQPYVAAQPAMANVVLGDGAPGSAIVTMTVGLVQLLSAPVPWAGSLAATSNALATEIMLGGSGYRAESTGAGVIVMAPESLGAVANGAIVLTSTSGQILASASATFAGGVTEALAKPQIAHITLQGTAEPADTWVVTVNGKAVAMQTGASIMGTQVLTHDSKMYCVAGPLVRFSKIADPTVWEGSGNGSGLLNVASLSEGSELLYGISPYQGQLAFFTASAIQIYSMVADPAANRLEHTIRNARAVTSALTQMGNIDTLFLTAGGVRSVRARQSTDAPVVQDVGSAIDTFVVDHIRSVGRGVVARAASALDPVDGRYLLAVGSRIFVFSYFPFGKISAWSYYEPGFVVQNFAVGGDRLYARSADTLYVYGGDDGTQYPVEGDPPAYVRLPFTYGSAPSRDKSPIALDGVFRGSWRARAYVDPDDETAVTREVAVAGVTYTGAPVRLSTTATHVSMEFWADGAGPAEINEVTIGFGE